MTTTTIPPNCDEFGMLHFQLTSIAQFQTEGTKTIRNPFPDLLDFHRENSAPGKMMGQAQVPGLALEDEPGHHIRSRCGASDGADRAVSLTWLSDSQSLTIP